MAAALSAMGELAQRHDPDEFLAALFLPALLREDFFTLIALRFELASIKPKVSEPLLGQIRLQWWREAIEGLAFDKKPAAHPVLEAVHRLVAHQARVKPMLLTLVEAFESDFAEQIEYLPRMQAYWLAKLHIAGLSDTVHGKSLAACTSAEALRAQLQAGQAPAGYLQLAARLREELGAEKLTGLAKIVFLPRWLFRLWLKKLQKMHEPLVLAELVQPSPWRGVALVWSAYLR